MNENKFIQKFQNKTDSELEYIIENKKNYNEQAVSASIQILKDRNGQSILLEKIENEIVSEKEQKETNKKQIIEEEKKRNNLTDDPNAPEMHSKGVIRVFSVLFSTIFGTVLMTYNLNQINKTKERNIVLLFGILYTSASIIIVNLLGQNSLLSMMLNIGGGGILTEYFWNKYIGKNFKHRKRSWIKPLIISIIIMIPFIWALFFAPK